MYKSREMRIHYIFNIHIQRERERWIFIDIKHLLWKYKCEKSQGFKKGQFGVHSGEQIDGSTSLAVSVKGHARPFDFLSELVGHRAPSVSYIHEKTIHKHR